MACWLRALARPPRPGFVQGRSRAGGCRRRFSAGPILTAQDDAHQGGGLRRVERALLSVSDKTELLAFGSFLQSMGVKIMSTGGTAKSLREGGVTVTDVSEVTGFPEILGGRVKSLHPSIHGGILAVRGNAAHDADLATADIMHIDMVVGNLYPFEKTVASEGVNHNTAMENVDIGGSAMLRAAAKNHASVAVVTTPSQYETVMSEMRQHDGCTTPGTRQSLAATAFAHTAHYDTAIANYMRKTVSDPAAAAEHNTAYSYELALRYGCNPHQQPAALCTVDGAKLPFSIMSGSPGYINLLDAVYAWQLVHELKQALGVPAATSFKHVSPAGAAIAVPLLPDEVLAYEAEGMQLTPVALAYLRARNADPKCSFGDFAAVSDVVDVATAKVLKAQVCDGIVAPGYEPEALEILRAKKNGKFVVLQADPDFVPPLIEHREIYGMCYMQRRNDKQITMEAVQDVVTANTAMTDNARRDLVMGNIAIKYTQSNSVGFCINGMMVGIGAGQQSRVDCVKLAGQKVQTWWLRQHPKVLGLKFKKEMKKQDRINARVRYVEGDLTAMERQSWEQGFEEVPEMLTAEEKNEWMKTLHGVGLCSDAFFPFRDGIDHASKYGVTYVSQPGGSVGDPGVIKAADEYGMVMAMSGVRLFHH